MARMRTMALIAAGAAVLVTAALVGASETVNYTYDAKGRLIKVEHIGTVNNNVVSNYSFDKADNRVNANVTGAP